MTKRHGFTVVEMLTCIAIIAIVAAITTPAIIKVKHNALVTQSISNLHQMSVALTLYRTEYDGDGKYGSQSEMGLPTQAYVTLNRFKTPLSIWSSPCGQNPAWEKDPIVIQYDYFPARTYETFSKLSELYHENLLMFDDLNCADHGEPLYSPYFDHLGLGVLLSGSLVKKVRAGDPRLQKWWASPNG